MFPRQYGIFLSINALLVFFNLFLWTYSPTKNGAAVVIGQQNGVTSNRVVESSISVAEEQFRPKHYGEDSDDEDINNGGTLVRGSIGKTGMQQNATERVRKKKRNIARGTEALPDISQVHRFQDKANTDITQLWSKTRNRTGFYSKSDLPQTDVYVTPPNLLSLQKMGFDKAREHYTVPRIQYTDLVDCARILANDSRELQKAQEVMVARPKVPIYEETYQEWTKDCEKFKRRRGYVTVPLSAEEEKYPLAFSIAMYTDVEQTERLLRAIYQPQNLYCIHIDTKTSVLIHNTMRSVAKCFDNVWIATHLDKVKWGDISVILPDINCMRDLVRYYKGKWKYFINLTGQEFPLRTNYELVQISKIFNGSNDISGSTSRMEMDRVKFYWTHRWSKTYQQTIFFNTFRPKPPPPYNLTFYKGELHALFSRRFVEYLVESEVSQRYLDWCWDSGHPSEHYWNVLNYNPQANAPGGYIGDERVADEYSDHMISRVKNWIGLYDHRRCQGKVVRGICVFGTNDTPWLATRPELFANKFHMTFQYLGYDCLEERHRNRTMLRGNVSSFFDPGFYRDLPTVKFSKKDGL